MVYPDWEKMYAILCWEIWEALDVLPLFPKNVHLSAVFFCALLDQPRAPFQQQAGKL